MSRDAGLDYLLALDGEILAQDKGYWVRESSLNRQQPARLVTDFFSEVDKVLRKIQ